MALRLAQLSHDPPALDLAGADHVLHLFQCQECSGYTTGEGNDAVMVPTEDLGNESEPRYHVDEDPSGIISKVLGQWLANCGLTVRPD